MAHALSNLAILPNQSFALYADTEDYRLSFTLATTSTAERFLVPSGAKYVVFGATGNFCVRYNTTTNGSAAAFGDVTDGSACEINPTIRYLRTTVAAISVIASASNVHVSASFYL
jgi:hypothetical protein